MFRTRWMRLAIGLALLTLGGCGWFRPADETPPDTQTRLGDSTAIDLAAWLKLPRAELAKLADEWTANVHGQYETIRNDSTVVDLLPGALPPLTVPGFHEARFVPAEGISLPPYLAPGVKDAAVALHLARLGDAEAARKLAPAGNAALLAHIDRLASEAEYPVEWTRLAGLVLLSAQIKVMMGDVDGATDLVLLHRQLTTLLDAKATASPLGAALLPQGKGILARAALAWRDPQRKKVALAEDVEQALADWGDFPKKTLAVSFGAPAAEVSRLLAVPPRGKAVLATTPPAVSRALDLLGLALPTAGAEVVTAFLDENDRLASLLVGYQANIDRYYADPGQLVYSFVEAGAEAQPENKTASLVQQSFADGTIRCDVLRSNRSLALGGLVQVLPEKGRVSIARTRSLRDFGPAHLDRTFEACRIVLTSGQADLSVTSSDPAILARIAAALETPVPNAFVFHRPQALDVVNGLEMSWKPDENNHALSRLLPSLWDDYGVGTVGAVEDAAGAYLAFRWSDADTDVQLRLAFDERGPVLVVRDVQDATKQPGRLVQAQQRDEQERQARLLAGKPELRLARSPAEVPGLTLEELQLGQPRAQAIAALPSGPGYRTAEVPEGVSVMLTGPVAATAPFNLRQVLVRFDTQERVREVRLRYQAGAAKAKKGESPLEQLSDGRAGAPVAIPARWAGLWNDVPEAGAAKSYRWADDRTIRVLNQDAEGCEVILTDRPGDNPSLELAPWQFLSRGLKGAGLGATKQEVRAALKPAVMSSNGADVHRMPATSPYEMVLVWYQDGKVMRLLAVHRDRPRNDATAAAEALAKAWGRDLDGLGYVRRKETARDTMLGTYFWNDDRVRVQSAVQGGEQGTRMTTEYRYWPIVVGKTTKQVSRAE